MMKYLKNIFIYLAVTIITCFIMYFMCRMVNLKGIVELLIKAIIGVCVPIIVQCILFSNKYEYIESKKLLKKMLKSVK